MLASLVDQAHQQKATNRTLTARLEQHERDLDSRLAGIVRSNGQATPSNVLDNARLAGADASPSPRTRLDF